MGMLGSGYVHGTHPAAFAAQRPFTTLSLVGACGSFRDRHFPSRILTEHPRWCFFWGGFQADGKSWALLSNSTWNCAENSCGKYGFWTVVDVQPGRAGRVVTFGGSNAYSTFGKLWSDTWEYDDTTTATTSNATTLQSR